MLLEVPDSDMPWLLLVLQYVSLRLPAKTYSASYSIILVGLRPSCNPSEWTAMNLETRQACKYVSLRLPGLWPLMSPLTLLANGGLVFMTVDT